MKTTLTYGQVGGSLHAFIGGVHRTAIAFSGRAFLAAGCFSQDAAKNAGDMAEDAIDGAVNETKADRAAHIADPARN